MRILFEAGCDDATLGEVDGQQFADFTRRATSLVKAIISAITVRLLISGARGPGGFPSPVSNLRASRRLWRWADVSRWFSALSGHDAPAHDASFIAALNSALELRHLAVELVEPEQRREVARFVTHGAALLGG